MRAAHIRIPEEQKYLKKSIPNQQLQPTRQAVSAVKPPTHSFHGVASSDTHSEHKLQFELTPHERNSSIDQPRSEFNYIQQQRENQTSIKKSHYKGASHSQLHESGPADPYLQAAENVGADYTLKEEPLPNPDKAI